MGAVNKDYLLLHCQEFADVDPARIDALNATAQLFVSQAVFGVWYQYALMLYIAHLLKLDRQKGKGMVSSQQVGSISKTYTAPEAISDLSFTTYGAQFSRITSLMTLGGVVSGTRDFVGMDVPE